MYKTHNGLALNSQCIRDIRSYLQLSKLLCLVTCCFCIDEFGEDEVPKLWSLEEQ